MNKQIPINELLRRFAEELLGQKDSTLIRDHGIASIIKTWDKDEQYYHVENDILWRIKDWRSTRERQDKLKQESEEYTRKVWNRKDALKIIMLRFSSLTGITDKKELFPMALNALRQIDLNPQLAPEWGITFKVEKLDQPYLVMEGRGYYEL